MKINLNSQIKKITGEDIEIKGSDEKTMSFKEVVINSALAEFQDDKIDGPTKFKRYELAKSISKCSDFADLTVEEISIIKRNAARILPVEAYGSFCEIIENSNQVKN